MNLDDRRHVNEALDWVRRLHDPNFADWNAHLAWLEADARNAAAFDEPSIIISELSEGLQTAGRLEGLPQPTNDNAAPGTSQRWYRGGIAGVAIAAGIVGVVALPSLRLRSTQSYEIRTGPGEHHSLTLGDGTQIALNGDTRLRLDRRAPRVAILEAGEAFFTVTHARTRTGEVGIYLEVGRLTRAPGHEQTDCAVPARVAPRGQGFADAIGAVT